MDCKYKSKQVGREQPIMGDRGIGVIVEGNSSSPQKVSFI